MFFGSICFWLQKVEVYYFIFKYMFLVFLCFVLGMVEFFIQEVGIDYDRLILVGILLLLFKLGCMFQVFQLVYQEGIQVMRNDMLGQVLF